MTSGPFDDDPAAPAFDTADDGVSDPFDTGDPDLDRLRATAQEQGEKADAVRSFWKELPFLIVVALVVAVIIKTFLIQAFFIPSASMHDTLLEGDRVMVNKLAYRFGEPHRGDVIVFDSPLVAHDQTESFLGRVVRNVGEALGLSTPESALIKRVIALGGETIEIKGNRIYIDGVAIDEPYLTRPVNMDAFGPLTIPQGYVFVMGDNRNQSEDGRVFGPIPDSDIIGRAFVRVWPPGRWGGL
ncbi:MAG TPA: signal peptidase I [Acidimicrobiia bacterium]|nr:signal peptidase I [Acidimicrobiia bacterium]